jgi:hypothetical protein
VSGVFTVRGIGYQQAQAVLEAIAALDVSEAAGIRVEGVEDVLDLEILDSSDRVLAGKQYKTRSEHYTWARSDLISVLRRWLIVPTLPLATFEFVTDGELGPSGEEIANALRLASSGDPSAIASLIGTKLDLSATERIKRAAIRQDRAAVGALLQRAERQVQAMLLEPRTDLDAQADAEAGVNRLFALLVARAGESDPGLRVIGRKEIASVLGIAPDQAAAQRWTTSLRQRYIEAAKVLDLGAFILPQVDRVTDNFELGASSPTPTAISSVLAIAETAPSILTGRTGAGKTTACETLVRESARQGQAVLLAHAEAYLPGRLAALAADAISEVLNESMPAASGRQALADSGTTLVIDGVSEVPPSLRASLAEDIRAFAASGQGAGIVLVGRESAVVRGVLPTSSTPNRYEVVGLDHSQRVEVASRLYREARPAQTSPRVAGEIRTLVA